MKQVAVFREFGKVTEVREYPSKKAAIGQLVSDGYAFMRRDEIPTFYGTRKVDDVGHMVEVMLYPRKSGYAEWALSQ